MEVSMAAQCGNKVAHRTRVPLAGPGCTTPSKGGMGEKRQRPDSLRILPLCWRLHIWLPAVGEEKGRGWGRRGGVRITCAPASRRWEGQGKVEIEASREGRRGEGNSERLGKGTQDGVQFN